MTCGVGRESPAGSRIGVSGCEIGASGNDFGARGNEIGACGRHFGALGRDIDARGGHFGVLGNGFGVLGSHFGARGNHFRALGCQVGTRRSHFGTRGNPGSGRAGRSCWCAVVAIMGSAIIASERADLMGRHPASVAPVAGSGVAPGIRVAARTESRPVGVG